MTPLAGDGASVGTGRPAPALRRVVAPSAPLRRHPRGDAPLDTEALMGERVAPLAAAPGEDAAETGDEGWVRVRLEADGYVGYLPTEALAPAGEAVPTHRVAALRTFRYPGPNLKLPPLDALPFGALVTVVAWEDAYARLAEGGFVHAVHLDPAGEVAPDFVAVAERFREVPYLWGGKTALGLDCSGLVQLALAAAGTSAPRDSGDQARALGRPLGEAEPYRRGDLAFWRGHVGILVDDRHLLHANGHHMTVAQEPFADARARILASGGGPVTAVRRPA